MIGNARPRPESDHGTSFTARLSAEDEPREDEPRDADPGVAAPRLFRGRMLLALSVLAILAAAAVGYILIERSAQRAIARNAERISFAWAQYMPAQLPDIMVLLTGNISRADEEILRRMTSFTDVFRFKLFDGEGRQILVASSDGVTTEADDLASHNPVAAEVLTGLEPYTAVEDGTEKPDRPDVYVESYVPITQYGTVVGVVEVYVDQTADAAAIHADYVEFEVLFGLVMLAAVSVPGLTLAMTSAKLRRQNAAIVAANHRARAGERSKSEFLATMSHEIRTPMNGVIGMAELMATTELDSWQRVYVETIQSSSKSLLAIINDILDFSKIDSGQLVLSATPFKVANLARDSVRVIAEPAAKKALEVLVRVAPDAPSHLVGDFDRLQQVVTNFLGNAVKFTDQGHIVVDISVETDGSAAADDGDATLVVEVRDTGIGVAPEDMERIFQMFSQVDSSSSRRHEGTGLGLSICKGLVDNMGGDIGVRPNQGGGSTFWFRVPLQRHEAGETPAALPFDARSLRVIAVDDNETNRLIVGEMLSSWSIDCSIVATGREAIQKMSSAQRQSRPFDVIILDHHMPRMDGEDVLREIRRTPELAGTAAILLTSITEGESIERCKALGLQGCLVKPTFPSRLLDAIMSAVGRSLHEKAAVSATARGPRAAPAARPTADGQTPDVMVVEDNEVNRLVIEQLLEQMGLSYRIAEDGEEAVAAYQQAPPRIILMDVSMPVMDGLEATGHIRAFEEANDLPRTPIVGVTAHAMSGDKSRCLDAGMDDYLAKPILTGKLRHLINTWLKNDRTQSARATPPLRATGSGG